MTRKSGCIIESCSKKEFDEAFLLVGLGAGEEKLKTVEGAIEELYFFCSPGTSGLQISRNASTALKSAGYQMLYQGKDVFEEHALTARKGNIWIAVRTNSEGRYNITTVEEQSMQQEMTAQWSGQLESSGRAVLEGIEFETDSHQLRPQSEAVLNQVLQLLEANPSWKLKIEGHTDTSGDAASNLTLSRARATTVLEWLTQHGIAPGRLLAEGFAGSKPRDTNATPEGRARNRRVELSRL